MDIRDLLQEFTSHTNLLRMGRQMTISQISGLEWDSDEGLLPILARYSPWSDDRWSVLGLLAVTIMKSGHLPYLGQFSLTRSPNNRLSSHLRLIVRYLMFSPAYDFDVTMNGLFKNWLRFQGTRFFHSRFERHLRCLKWIWHQRRAACRECWFT